MNQINPQEFKTKTIIKPAKNPCPKQVWPIAIDIGYSSTKVMSPNSNSVFPSYAKKVAYGTADKALKNVGTSAIAYRDENGNEYFVGQNALDDASETDGSASMLYSRDRYLKPEFLVLIRVALGLACMEGREPAPQVDKIAIATGLPPAFLAEDSELLKEAMQGEHCFSLKVGNDSWREYQLTIGDHSDFVVMDQPMGTLYSISADMNGGQVPEARKYFSSSLVIFDPGFGTLDLFSIKNGFIKGSSSRDDLGMRAVLEKTGQLLKEKGVSKSVHNITAALPKGYVTSLDRRSHSNKAIDFSAELEAASKSICNQALDFLDVSYNYLEDVDYLVVTGGTGAAWEKMIRNRYKDMDTLSIVMGNASDPGFDMIMANVRGYYMYLVGKYRNA